MTFGPTTLAGNWWLPGGEESAASGDLVYGDEGLRLTLRGTLIPKLQLLQALGSASSVETFPLVLGETTTGKRVTLEEALVVGTQMQLMGPGVPTQRLLPKFAYVGVHVTSPGDLTWTRARFRFRHLTEWLGEDGVGERPLHDDDGQPMGYVLEYRKPPRRVASADGGLIELIPEFLVEGQSLRGRTLTPRATWDVKFEEALPLAGVVERFVSPLQDLVALGNNTACPLTDLRLYDDEYVQPGTTHQLDVEVLYDSYRVGLDVDNILTRQEMLFAAGTLGARFDVAIAAWLKVWADLRSVCGLVFGPEYVGQDMFDNRVMNSVQAAEALHRTRFSTLERPAEAHEKRVGAVLQAAPPEYRNWLERKLRFSNEVDLGRRLRELYEHVQGVASGLVPDREGFIQQLVQARNSLAHRGTFPPGTDVAGLHHAVEALNYIMRACFVRELGFGDSETAHLFQQNSRYRSEVKAGRAP